MSNIFFGKISKKFDIEQIEKGYYRAGKDSGWFGDLRLGDYVYLIGGDKIQLWQAREWSKDNDCLHFEILNNDLGIGVNEFVSLNFLKLTKTLIVLSSRSARNRAFFKLDIIKEYDIDQLKDSNFYKDSTLYRNITFTDKDRLNPDSLDIQMYNGESGLALYHSTFFSDDVYNSFKDNRKMMGKGAKRKDNTLEAMQNAINKGNMSFSPKDLGLISFYDALFCDYKDKDKEVRINELDLDEDSEDNSEQLVSEVVNLLRHKNNVILQGAPGTGKTYHTSIIAEQLCNEGVEENKSYKTLVDEGRIMFTTFHQSMDYEDFVEGIKPDSATNSITYRVIPGLFKQICEKAKAPIIINNDLKIRNNPTIWKVSLKGTYDNDIRTDCMANDRIRIGWDGYGENIEDDSTYPDGGMNVLYAFINKMQIGDIVMSCYTQTTIDAIGVITGEYEWDDNLTEYKRCRKVNWLVKGVNEDIFKLNNETLMVQGTVYRLNNMSLEDVMPVLEKYNAAKNESIQKNTNPYILIVDEINRGNISKILGELITLLESDKRAGEDNEVKVKLPYSHEEFSVPSNLYIIGTMNTTDRSVGHIDYAIRRRFAFYTLTSNKEAIISYYEVSAEFEKDTKEVALDLFDKVYEYVQSHKSAELDIEDLMIGHSYFMAKNKDELKIKLQYEILPLLKEYEKDGIITLDQKERKELGSQWMELFV
ncbi:MAG: AAA family ATPase [Bacteroidales bacterium]